MLEKKKHCNHAEGSDHSSCSLGKALLRSLAFRPFPRTESTRQFRLSHHSERFLQGGIYFLQLQSFVVISTTQVTISRWAGVSCPGPGAEGPLPACPQGGMVVVTRLLSVPLCTVLLSVQEAV